MIQSYDNGCPQRGGQFSVTAAQMDNQPPLDARTPQDLSGPNGTGVLSCHLGRSSECDKCERK